MLKKILSGGWLFLSLLVIISSFSAIRDNHKNYIGLIDSYEKLALVYEKELSGESPGIAVTDRVEFLKSEIQRLRRNERSHDYELDLNNMYFMFLLGLLGLGVFEILNRSRS